MVVGEQEGEFEGLDAAPDELEREEEDWERAGEDEEATGRVVINSLISADRWCQFEMSERYWRMRSFSSSFVKSIAGIAGGGSLLLPPIATPPLVDSERLV